MATINIKASTVSVTEKRAAELCSILAELGIEFTFTPTKNPIPQKDELFKDAHVSVRALRIVRLACEEKGLDWQKMTVKTFSDTFGRSDLRKLRNCGKRSLEEIQNILHEHGYLMMI